MNVVERRYGNAVVVRVNGRLDQETCDDLRAELTGQVDRAASEKSALILDFSGLEYVSSAGLRCLLIASRQMKAANGRIMVAEMQPMVAEIFAISHFDMMFEVKPTVRDALASVSAEAANAYPRS
jgi:anti-sigma B factor antagonist